MINLSLCVKEYLKENSIDTVNFGTDVKLWNDGNGNYIKEWNLSSVPEPTMEQLATYENDAVNNEKWEVIREKRNKLLAETDFYALSDVTMTTEMSNYRQALRDLPSTTSNPDDVVFPTKP